MAGPGGGAQGLLLWDEAAVDTEGTPLGETGAEGRGEAGSLCTRSP